MLTAPTLVRAEADFDPESSGWNGLGSLVALGREAGVVIRTPSEFDVDALAPTDGVLVVGPGRTLPRAALVRFLHAGGRLAIADDFGTAGAFLAAFEIGRHAPRDGADSMRLRDNRNLRVAELRQGHPLARGASAIASNHAQVLHHPSLTPVATFSGERDALVLVGAVGAGRLVAIGDGSVLINNMLQFGGNRAFAINLLRYLAQNGRVVLLAGDTPSVGDPQFVPARSLRDLRTEIARLARVELPPPTLRALTGVFALIVLVAALSSLPSRSAWTTTTRVPTPLLLARTGPTRSARHSAEHA